MTLKEFLVKRKHHLIFLALIASGIGYFSLRNARNPFYSPVKTTVPKNEVPTLEDMDRKNGSCPGVVVLGMHRSGTSMLGGLLAQTGLSVGGPLLPPNWDNPRGYFERVDVMDHNDRMLAAQGTNYSYNTYKFDSLSALQNIFESQSGNHTWKKHSFDTYEALEEVRFEKDGDFFAFGKNAISFYNNPESHPWMMKDPRLCITLRAWLPFLAGTPAILFTYRHPFDVALSMSKRSSEYFRIERGLRLWYVYTMFAIRNSMGLCRVITSIRMLLMQPVSELWKIVTGLRRCGVAVPGFVSNENITAFVDIGLQHGKTVFSDNECTQDFRYLHTPAMWNSTESSHIALYRETVRVFCALEDRSAFKLNFEWDETIRDT